MNYLKKFESLRSPMYNKGEILVISEFKDLTYDTAVMLAKRLGYQIVGEPYDGFYLVKCEPGKEEECAKKLIERFPDFFNSYEREDIRMPFISNEIDRITTSVESIADFFERTDRKFVNIKKYNSFIDKIKSDLDKLKIEE